MLTNLLARRGGGKGGCDLNLGQPNGISVDPPYSEWVWGTETTQIHPDQLRGSLAKVLRAGRNAGTLC